MNEHEINKTYIDKYGRISAILAINKPKSITSHDLVDKIRKKLKTRRVGHTGALDPFATGLMIILVGKNTKLANNFLLMDKEYEFDLLLGVTTGTLDPEGKTESITNVSKLSEEKISKYINKFKGISYQEVPIYSSVKVNGIRLRELAHSATRIKKEDSEVNFKIDSKSRIFKKLKRQGKLDRKNIIKVKIPERKVNIKQIEVLEAKVIKSNKIEFLRDEKKTYKLMIIKLRAKVSKGTYIRQLAKDIGEEIGNIPAMLYTLKRTRVGNIALKEAIKISQLETE